MEMTCFLTSKASPTLLSPAGLVTKHRRTSQHQLFSNRRATSSVVVTCCSYNAPSSSDNNGAAPSIEPTDWRSFRAQLVHKERVSNSSSVHSAVLGAAEAPGPAVKVADKWAHLLAEPEKGCLLVATEKLHGSHIFERTVVLLLSAGGVLGTPVGVILNRPSLMSIKEAQPGIFAAETDIAGAFSGCPLFFGGPLEEECFFLLGSADGDKVVGRTGLFEEVMPGLHYGTTESVGCAAELVKCGVVRQRDLQFFDGFCGWERDQLRDEVRAGLWRVAACSTAVLGSTGGVVKGELWEEVQGLIRKKRVW